MSPRLPTSALVALLWLALPQAEAGIYRWTDADGQVHYSESPPPGTDSERVRVYGGTGDPDAADRAAERFDSQLEERDQAREAAATAAAEQAEKANRCREARERVSYFENRSPYYIWVKDDGGQQARMTEEQHAEQLAEARRRAALLCE